MSGPASMFIEGGSRLAVGVQEVDGIDSFFRPGSAVASPKILGGPKN